MWFTGSGYSVSLGVAIFVVQKFILLKVKRQNIPSSQSLMTVQNRTAIHTGKTAMRAVQMKPVLVFDQTAVVLAVNQGTGWHMNGMPASISMRTIYSSFYSFAQNNLQTSFIRTALKNSVNIGETLLSKKIVIFCIKQITRGQQCNIRRTAKQLKKC